MPNRSCSQTYDPIQWEKGGRGVLFIIAIMGLPSLALAGMEWYVYERPRCCR